MEIFLTRDLLYDEFQHNREIEFSLRNLKLFAEPTTDWYEPRNYAVWDVMRHICIVSGSIDQVFAYKFLDMYSLDDNFEEFDFHYIL